jgi:flavin reductase (DIM6/NTAB) family NADH-FMN oxidoreductase RutF
MNYDPDLENHGLPHSPFKSCCVPRPIGWISTLSADGVANLAPFSQFQNVTYDPPTILISANQRTIGRRKDTVVNIEETGEFVWNMATYDLREAVNRTSQEFPPEVDEFETAGLEKLPSLVVKPPRVAASPVHFECRHLQTIRIPGNGEMGSADIVIGRVVKIHIADDALTADGRLDIAHIKPLARLGYYDYTYVEKTFTMLPPGDDPRRLKGLAGDRVRD